MTQIEFENELRELRCQKGAAISAIAMMQGEVKEEISAIDRQIKDLRTRREKLNQQRIVLGNQRFAIEKEWGEKIRKFFDENYTTSRELEQVSEWALAAELRHRGYSGHLDNPDKEPEFLDNLNAKLNGAASED